MFFPLSHTSTSTPSPPEMVNFVLHGIYLGSKLKFKVFTKSSEVQAQTGWVLGYRPSLDCREASVAFYYVSLECCLQLLPVWERGAGIAPRLQGHCERSHSACVRHTVGTQETHNLLL